VNDNPPKMVSNPPKRTLGLDGHLDEIPTASGGIGRPPTLVGSARESYGGTLINLDWYGV
jgi:hypothetical protein